MLNGFPEYIQYIMYKHLNRIGIFLFKKKTTELHCNFKSKHRNLNFDKKILKKCILFREFGRVALLVGNIYRGQI